MSKYIRRFGRFIINRIGRLCGCTAKPRKESYQTESGEHDDLSQKQQQDNNQNSGEGDTVQKTHECDDETSSEVTPEFGYEELEEGSSSRTESSEEENPSGFQSSLVVQETQSDNQTDCLTELTGYRTENTYIKEEYQSDEETSSETTPEFGYEDLLEEYSSWTESSEEEYPPHSQSSMVVPETQSDNQTEGLAELTGITSTMEPTTSLIDCDIIQVMNILLDQVEKQLKNSTKEILTDNEDKSDLKILTKAHSNGLK
ncbi:hypothetical protein JTE90_029362 [Oedothorax gibbosus]|uniref:Uncharacterized protein n=1 Tax=Oedothorax gibbosus TaxID=931172 RepID=A0AAV6VMC5_9ARAC|nr:hypothetical protein JTE90_029362 [Oedothorax gibbosus]